MKTNPVLVTTEHRGVFFGYLGKRKPAKAKLTLEHCRCCVYWSSEMRGFLGLATHGPDSDCKIGPAAPKVTLFDVTSVTAVSEQAAKKWENATW